MTRSRVWFAAGSLVVPLLVPDATGPAALAR